MDENTEITLPVSVGKPAPVEDTVEDNGDNLRHIDLDGELTSIISEIDGLGDLDPADVAHVGARIADVLSRALEEEEGR